MSSLRTLAHGGGCQLCERAGRLVLRALTPSARPTLAEVRGVHEAVEGGALPAVEEASEDELRFDVQPLGTLDQLLRSARRDGVTIDYATALGLGARTSDVYAAIRRARPGQASGRLSAGQIVFDRDGGVHFLGPATSLSMDRGADGAHSPFVAIAPEVLRGGAPVASSDVYAAAQLAVLTAPFLRFPAALGDALSGGRGEALVEAARYFDTRVATHVLAQREDDLSEVLKRFEGAWSASELRWSADEAVVELGRVALTLLAPRLEQLRITPGGQTLRRGIGPTVSLARRAAPRRLLAALVQDRLEAGPGLDFEQMVRAGWLDERILPDAARARVHMAVSTLRKLGLEDWLEHVDGRYRIAPNVAVSVIEGT